MTDLSASDLSASDLSASDLSASDLSASDLSARAPAQVGVVPMRRRHLRQVVRIDGQATGDRWSPGLFLAELRRGDGSRCYRVAIEGSQVVGFAGLLYAADDGHVTTVAVDNACRRRGIATALLAALAADARARGCAALTLEVRAGNTAALALYRRFGFAPAGVRKGYYTDNGEDALVLWATGIDSAAYAARLEALSVGGAP